MPRLAGVVRLGAGARQASRLRLIEHLPVDDAQLWHAGPLPLLLRIDARHPLAGVGILDHAHPVPHQAPGIDLILQDALPAFGVPKDRARRPMPPARRRHALAVELERDGRAASRRSPRSCSISAAATTSPSPAVASPSIRAMRSSPTIAASSSCRPPRSPGLPTLRLPTRRMKEAGWRASAPAQNCRTSSTSPP